LAALGLFALSVLAAGCTADDYGIYRHYEVDGSTNPNSVILDAKERAIIAVKQPTKIDTKSSKKKDDNTETTTTAKYYTSICAEPSPDALSSIASALSISAGINSGGDQSKNAAAAFQGVENAEDIGVRDATIQILRDAYYRQCEAAMDGDLKGDDYLNADKRLLDSTVTLLAVEGLTRPPAYRSAVLSPRLGGTITDIGIRTGTGQGGFLPEGEEVTLTNNTPFIHVDTADSNKLSKFTIDGKGQTATLKALTPVDLENHTNDKKVPAKTKVTLTYDTYLFIGSEVKYDDPSKNTGNPRKPKDPGWTIEIPAGQSIILKNALTIRSNDNSESIGAGTGATPSNPSGGGSAGGSPPQISEKDLSTVAKTVQTIVSYYLTKDAFDSHQKDCEMAFKMKTKKDKPAAIQEKIRSYDRCMKTFKLIVTGRNGNPLLMYGVSPDPHLNNALNFFDLTK